MTLHSLWSDYGEKDASASAPSLLQACKDACVRFRNRNKRTEDDFNLQAEGFVIFQVRGLEEGDPWGASSLEEIKAMLREDGDERYAKLFEIPFLHK